MLGFLPWRSGRGVPRTARCRRGRSRDRTSSCFSETNMSTFKSKFKRPQKNLPLNTEEVPKHIWIQSHLTILKCSQTCPFASKQCQIFNWEIRGIEPTTFGLRAINSTTLLQVQLTLRGMADISNGFTSRQLNGEILDETGSVDEPARRWTSWGGSRRPSSRSGPTDEFPVCRAPCWPARNRTKNAGDNFILNSCSQSKLLWL